MYRVSRNERKTRIKNPHRGVRIRNYGCYDANPKSEKEDIKNKKF